MSSLPSPLGIFVGQTTIDVQYRVAAVPRADMGAEADESIVAPGGPSYTAAVTFAALGGRAICVSAAGAEPLRPLVLADAREFGVEYQDCAAPGSRLSVSTVLTDAEGRRTIISHDLAATANADLLTLPTVSPDVIAWDGFHPTLFDRITDAFPQVPVLLDGGRWLASLAGRLHRVRWAVVSERFRVPGAPGDPAGTMAALRAAGCAGAAVTRGDRPVLVDVDGSVRELVPPTGGPIVDTLGAGDILHGAAALALARGAGFVDAIVMGCAEATASCAVFGTRAWLRARRAHPVEP
ncbi:MAG: carbohydrate kinase [Gemmatimonadetes bacterium]|nr:carbohydrate kinase [Gemmatimonadota bacterium]